MLYLDGKVNPDAQNVQYMYNVDLKTNYLPDDICYDLGLRIEDVKEMCRTGQIPLTKAAKTALEKQTAYVNSVTPVEQKEIGVLYPKNAYTGWTCDNYGPVWIPKKGEKIKLTLENLPVYERPIRIYEGNTLDVTPEGKIIINGMVKADITEPDEEGNYALRFFVAAIEQSYHGFKENLTNYIHIIEDGQRRLGDLYEQYEKEKKETASLNGLANSSFNQNGKTPS